MQRYLIVGLIVLIVAAYMATYTVRFTETAIVTTFGKAGEGSVKDDPRLKFKVPYVQQVTKYDRRARFLESTPEAKPTADLRPVVVTAFLTWKVADALKFYQSFSAGGERAEDHYRQAEQYLRGQIRAAMSEVSTVRMDEILSATPGGSRIAQLEERMLASLRKTLEAQGIHAESVGIDSIELPESVTQAVFDRMKATQEKRAKELISEGESQASTIKSGAESDACRSARAWYSKQYAELSRASGTTVERSETGTGTPNRL